MIAGIGTDIVDVRRMSDMLQHRGDKAMARILHPDEIALCVARYGATYGDRHARFLAKRFAGKEAFSKALGTGISGGMRFTDICIINDEAGAPFLHCTGVTAGIMRTRFGPDAKVHLSLSDERDTSIAFVVIER